MLVVVIVNNDNNVYGIPIGRVVHSEQSTAAG